LLGDAGKCELKAFAPVVVGRHSRHGSIDWYAPVKGPSLG
jgi:hypothetical protein